MATYTFNRPAVVDAEEFFPAMTAITSKIQYMEMGEDGDATVNFITFAGQTLTQAEIDAITAMLASHDGAAIQQGRENVKAAIRNAIQSVDTANAAELRTIIKHMLRHMARNL